MAEQETNTQSTNTEAQKTKSPMGRYLIGGVVVIAIGLAVWGLNTYSDLFSGMEGADDITTEREYPDVVARVNDEEITGSEFAAGIAEYQQSAVQQGLDPNNPEAMAQIEEQVLTALMNRTIVMQNATAAGITASAEEVDQRISEIEEQMGGAEALQTQMTNLGITDAELRHNLEQDIIVNTYLQSNIADSDTTVTDEEVNDFYAQISAQQEEGAIPPLEEIAEQIRQQLVTQKEQTAIQAFIRELQTAANIEVFI